MVGTLRIVLLSILTAPLLAGFLELPATAETTTVAALLPLTGNGAEQGEWVRRGIELAQERLRQDGVGNFELLLEDTKGGDPRSALQAYRAAFLQKRFRAVITWGSGVGVALSPVTNGDDVLQMGVATASPKYRSEGDLTFRVFPSASDESDFLADQLRRRLSLSEIAVFSINNDYGVGTSGAVSAAFIARGGQIRLHETYNPDESDWRSLLLKLKRFPELTVYLAAYPTDGALILRQAKELGLQNQFISSVAIIGGRDFFSLAGDAANGLLVASTKGDSQSPFWRVYAEKYPGESPAQEIYAARAYDAMMLLGAALRQCGAAGAECLRNELLRVKDFPGASATLAFDSAGDIQTGFSLFRVSGGQFNELD